MTTTDTLITMQDVSDAHERIRPFIHRTPTLTCSAINDRAGCDVVFKCENFQKIGAFKIRGATNAILQLDDTVAAQGVVTHSSGNHAQATALAARQRGIDAHIIMPRTAPAVKKAAVIEYGGIIYECEPNENARLELALKVQQDTGATMIPPFDHPHIIAGQATASVELLEDHPDINGIIAPIGGGGLMAGTCIAAHAINKDISIIGAEPSAAADAVASFQSGTRQPGFPAPQTIADGLLTGVGALTWPYIQSHVSDILDVDDDAIRQAMSLFLLRMKILVEPSGAVPLATILSDDFRTKWIDNGRITKLGVIITGGNVSLDGIPGATA